MEAMACSSLAFSHIYFGIASQATPKGTAVDKRQAVM